MLTAYTIDGVSGHDWTVTFEFDHAATTSQQTIAFGADMDSDTLDSAIRDYAAAYEAGLDDPKPDTSLVGVRQQVIDLPPGKPTAPKKRGKPDSSPQGETP